MAAEMTAERRGSARRAAEDLRLLSDDAVRVSAILVADTVAAPQRSASRD